MPKNEVIEMIDMVEQANFQLDQINELWDKYNQLKKDLIMAGALNIYLNNRKLMLLLQYADNYKSEFGNIVLMESAIYLIRQNRTYEQIVKIINVAYLMSNKNSVNFAMSARLLNESLSGINGFNTIPEIKNLSKFELASGKAVEIIENILEAKNG